MAVAQSRSQAVAASHRRHSLTVMVDRVAIGGGAPVVVQSMTDTNTSDIAATVRQVRQLALAGSEIVRITVNDEEAARAVPRIRELLDQSNCNVPLAGDFHYNGDQLLAAVPDCAVALAKYRINPGNVGFGENHDRRFAAIVELAVRHSKAVRIGVNWGSLDQALLQKMMDENAKAKNPSAAVDVMLEALVQSALKSAEFARSIGLAEDKIVISSKVSEVQPLIKVYSELAQRCNYPLHLGLTEAGMGSKGIIASAAAMAILLQQGIGDTIRVSLTPAPGEGRTREVQVAQELLQTMGMRSFTPMVTACPGCGRTSSSLFRELADTVQKHVRERMPVWRELYPGVESLTLAVMGCVVNGPGESRYADIGISLPGRGEAPAMPVFIDGKKSCTLRGDNVSSDFLQLIENYVQKRYGRARQTSATGK